MNKTITEFDTITAISTPVGTGAISIVRLSGPESLAIASKILKNKDLAQVPSHTINYAHIIDPDSQEMIDEVMVSVMKAPKTFTREDVVEINCHGGITATNKILNLLLTNGARMAEPGEFTKRAFLNGRIDLTQAESVMDIIEAKTDRSRKIAVGQLGGNLSTLINDLRQEILDTLSLVEVSIDYPEYDSEEITLTKMDQVADKMIPRLNKLIKTANEGKIYKEGLRTAIVGLPNVGKSSLLNNLLDEEKAIVTQIAGTTRDTLEELVNINDIPLHLIDTAGIRETSDVVEKIGVERSRKAVEQADLVLLVLNNNETLSAGDYELLKLTDQQKRIIVLNKTDLPAKLDRAALKPFINENTQIVQESALENKNLDELKTAISEMFLAGIENSKMEAMVTNARQLGLLKNAAQALTDVKTGISNGLPVDIVQIDLTSAWEYLGEVVGKSQDDELINELFTRFCLGK